MAFAKAEKLTELSLTPNVASSNAEGSPSICTLNNSVDDHGAEQDSEPG